MKKILLSLMLAVTAFCASAAVGDIFSDGWLKFEVIDDDVPNADPLVEVISLSDRGKNADSINVVIPRTVAYNSKTYKVASVGKDAFRSARNVYTITVSYGVTQVKNYAFAFMANLSELNLPSSVTSIGSYVAYFSGMLAKINYAYPLTSSRSPFFANAFDGIPSFCELVVPKTGGDDIVEKFKSHSQCSAFKTIKVGSSACDFRTLDGGMYCVTEAPTKTTPGEITMVGFNSRATGELELWFTPSCADSMYVIDDYKYKFVAIAPRACYDLYGIGALSLSKLSYLRTIGESAFDGCWRIYPLYLPNSLQRIERRAFAGIDNNYLKEFTLPAGVTYCDPSFVDDMPKLERIEVDDANRSYYSLGGILYNYSRSTIIRCPEGLAGNPTYDGIGTAGDSRFDTDSVISIVGDSAFKHCNKLATIYLPYGISTIGKGAFYGCEKLSHLYVPSSIRTWGAGAMRNTKLSGLHVNTPNPPVLSSNEFEGGGSKYDLYVPFGAEDTYRNAPVWSQFKRVQQGSYDICVAGKIASTDTKTTNAYFTITSNKPEVIGGVQYAGRAQIVNFVPYVDCVDFKTGDYMMCCRKKYAITSIGSNIFPEGMRGDAAITLGENIDTIADYAFVDKANVVKVNFNSGLRYIGIQAFVLCGITGDVVLPFGIRHIGRYAFYGNPFTTCVVPSSVQKFDRPFGHNTNLEYLVLNSPDWTEGYNLEEIPTTCRLLVPTGSVNQYKNDPYWGQLQVAAGAFDFPADGTTVYNASKYVTVTGDRPIRYKNMRYDGSAKYVYCPFALDRTGVFSAKMTETSTLYDNGKKYLMTAFGDSALVGKRFQTVEVDSMQALQRIGKCAFQNSWLTKFTVPESCTYIGDAAFGRCTRLSELLILGTSGTDLPTFGGQIFGGNAADFKCYVLWDQIPQYRSLASSWVKVVGETNYPKDRFHSYLKIDTDEPMTAITVFDPVDWNASLLNAYTITGYDATRKLVNAQKVTETSSTVGVLVDGYNKGHIFRLIPPAETPEPTVSLLSAVTRATPIRPTAPRYGFDGTSKKFVLPDSSYTMPTGYAYLQLADAFGAGLTSVGVDLWTTAIPGDITGEGNVDVSDITALINKVLGSTMYSDEVCDIDGNLRVDVSDITALINIVLGK